MLTNTQGLSNREFTTAIFRANPAQWHYAADLEQMLSLLHHLANDGNVTVALLAAGFAERTFPYAGANKGAVLRCVTAVRTWASNQTDANLQECKDAAAAAAYASCAAASDASAASAAAYASYAASAAAYASYAAASYASTSAAYASTSAAYAASAASAALHREYQWQLAHTRKKHPLTEL